MSGGTWLRWWRPVAGLVLLAALAGAYFPRALDDTFITAGYARSLVERGDLAYFANGRAEGYSNFPWLLAQVPGVLLGVDLGLWAKLASLLSGVALVLALDRWLPRDRRGGLAFFAVLAWTPVAYWSAMGMETIAFTLLVAAGWRSLALNEVARGCWWLAGAAWVHPEGAAYLAAGVLLLALHRRFRWRAVLPPIAAVAVWHACRAVYFGDVLPAPIRLKALVGWFWLPQLAFELVAAAGVLLATFGAYRVARGARSWALVPVALSVATLAGVNGDWMGCGRLLLPGLLAGALVAVACGEPAPPRWIRGRFAPTLVLALVCSALEPRFLALPAPRAIVPRYHEGIETPLAGVVAYLVDHTPAGGVVHSADIGFIGHIPDLAVIDSRGLVNRRFLLAKHAPLAELRPLYASAERPDVIMVGRFLPEWVAEWQPELLSPPEGLDPWLRELDDVLAGWPVHRDIVIHEHGWVGVVRFHHRDDALPSLEVRRARWRELHERFPSQPWLRDQRLTR